MEGCYNTTISIDVMCRKKETAYRFPLSTDSENRSRCAAGSKRPATRNGGEAYWQLLYSPPLTHIYRNWRSPSTFCYIASYPTCFLFLCSCFFLCLLCRLLIKEFTSMSTSTAPLISFLLFQRLKREKRTVVHLSCLSSLLLRDPWYLMDIYTP